MSCGLKTFNLSITLDIDPPFKEFCPTPLKKIYTSKLSLAKINVFSFGMGNEVMSIKNTCEISSQIQKIRLVVDNINNGTVKYIPSCMGITSASESEQKKWPYVQNCEFDSNSTSTLQAGGCGEDTESMPLMPYISKFRASDGCGSISESESKGIIEGINWDPFTSCPPPPIACDEPQWCPSASAPSCYQCGEWTCSPYIKLNVEPETSIIRFQYSNILPYIDKQKSKWLQTYEGEMSRQNFYGKIQNILKEIYNHHKTLSISSFRNQGDTLEFPFQWIYEPFNGYPPYICDEAFKGGCSVSPEEEPPVSFNLAESINGISAGLPLDFLQSNPGSKKIKCYLYIVDETQPDLSPCCNNCNCFPEENILSFWEEDISLSSKRITYDNQEYFISEPKQFFSLKFIDIFKANKTVKYCAKFLNT